MRFDDYARNKLASAARLSRRPQLLSSRLRGGVAQAPAFLPIGIGPRRPPFPKGSKRHGFLEFQRQQHRRPFRPGHDLPQGLTPHRKGPDDRQSLGLVAHPLFVAPRDPSRGGAEGSAFRRRMYRRRSIVPARDRRPRGPPEPAWQGPDGKNIRAVSGAGCLAGADPAAPEAGASYRSRSKSLSGYKSS